MIRRFGETPEPGQSYRVRHGVYAILPLRDQLLLTWQDDPHFELQLPGGGIDPGESPIHALHREVMEETGWTIAKPLRLGAFRRFTFMPEYDMWAEKVCSIYVAHPVRPIGPPTETDHTPLFATPEQATRDLYNEGDRFFVSRYMGWA
ncbi:NUDIX domain-containing protein [Roseovarius faecimaris]|uniref:NUDIX domain-containing protein n=1 Tax=Roseovarius faecimaris TaxID=2494550 RepID=A0A6I6IVM0_9RHOB|nr:NUDIX hydrolase [Roseovarius faecimaris]QGY00125.1 NUDIX domain-containing protein [Roseovarius faecimaris]